MVDNIIIIDNNLWFIHNSNIVILIQVKYNKTCACMHACTHIICINLN